MTDGKTERNGTAAASPMFRARTTHEDSRVAYVELFFDLVFVFAITQISHSLLHRFDLSGIAAAAFLTLAVWWIWIFTTWVTNWLNPQSTPVRLMLFALMLAGLVLSASIPGAFGPTGIAFAVAYVFMQVGRSLFMCWALRNVNARNYRNFVRISAWLCLSGLLWIAGGLAAPELRPFWWGAALAVEYASPALGFWTPGLGRSTTADWDVSGAHMAERCGLFIIIALGESLLVSGSSFAALAWTPVNLAAFFVAFAGSVAMWWVYFNLGADHASERISRSADPGRLARLAYTYLHLPIVGGIIVTAVSDEFILAHPTGHAEPLVAAAVLGGPALFIAGNFLFKLAVFRVMPWSHVAGLALLGLAAIACGTVPPVALAALATVSLAVVGAWENIAVKRGMARHG